MWRLAAILLWPAAIGANMILTVSSSQSSPDARISPSHSQRPNYSIQPTISQPLFTIAQPTLLPSQSSNFWDPLSSATDHFLDEISEHLHVDLRKRQGGAPITAAPPATTAAHQLSPVVTYQSYNAQGQAVNLVFTQTFAAVPDQWANPSQGSVGMGTIQGTIGVVKSKRGLDAEATAFPGQVLRIKGRDVTMS